MIPEERITQNLPLKIIGIDYAGPFIRKTKVGKETKVSILLLLFICSLTRAIHLEFVPDQSTQEFIMVLKRSIARRNRKSVTYSDNAETLVAASKWIGKIN